MDTFGELKVRYKRQQVKGQAKGKVDIRSRAKERSQGNISESIVQGFGKYT